MYVSMGFYSAHNYSGLVRQASGFITVTVSKYGTCRILHSTGFKGGGKPCLKTRETAVLRSDIWFGCSYRNDIGVPKIDLAANELRL